MSEEMLSVWAKRTPFATILFTNSGGAVTCVVLPISARVCMRSRACAFVGVRKSAVCVCVHVLASALLRSWPETCRRRCRGSRHSCNLNLSSPELSLKCKSSAVTRTSATRPASSAFKKSE